MCQPSNAIKCLTQFRLFNPHKQANNIGNIFVSMCSSIAIGLQIHLSPISCSARSGGLHFPGTVFGGFWLGSACGRHWKESEAKAILPPFASGSSNLLSNCSSCWVPHLCHPAAPSIECPTMGPGSGVWECHLLLLPFYPWGSWWLPAVANLQGTSPAPVWLLSPSSTSVKAVLYYLYRMFLLS